MFWNCFGGGLNKRKVFLMDDGGRYVGHSSLYTLCGSRAGMTNSRWAVSGEIKSASLLPFSGVIRVCVVD